MLILTAENEIKNTDQITESVHYSVLSFKDFKCPDFFFRKIEFLEEFNSASITLYLGGFEIVMPLHWSVLCTDLENVQSLPLHEAAGRDFFVFCLNPINGYMPEFFPLRAGMVLPNTTWMAPPVEDKDMLVVPLGAPARKPKKVVEAEAVKVANSNEVITIPGKEVPEQPVESEPPVENRFMSRRKGPVCAMFSPSKLEINRPISDIW
jgi:hypothetical protein